MISPDHHPALAPYRQWLRQTGDAEWPTLELLNSWLTGGISSRSGAMIRFESQDELEAGDYEHRIYETGAVSTRPNNLHDLCNALVWCRFPHIKAALNALHYSSPPARKGQRGSLKDAITLFDESGIILISEHRQLIEAVAQFRWQDAFVDLANLWETGTRVFVPGHALLEKTADVYKSMTGHTMLIHSDAILDPTEQIDKKLASRLAHDHWLGNTTDLTPLPMCGIPGYWTRTPQDQAFYDDVSVFRPMAENRKTAPIRRW